MNLKNINKLLLIFISFIISCKTINNLSESEQVNLTVLTDSVEKSENINNSIRVNNKKYIDYYSFPTNFFWKKNKELNKIIVFKNSKKKIFRFQPIKYIY